jgi:hypothetical protein
VRNRRWGRRAGLFGVLALLLATMTACVEGTVTYNSNPQGDPNVKCVIELRISDREGGESTKRFEHRTSTCRMCPVGSSFPACKKERKDDKKDEGGGLDIRRGDKSAYALIVQVVGTSTSPGLKMEVWIYNKDGDTGQPLVYITDTRDHTERLLVQSTDRRIRVRVTPIDPGASVTCEIFGPMRAPWKDDAGGGGVTCESPIAEKLN